MLLTHLQEINDALESESQIFRDRLNDFSVFLPMLKLVAAFIIVPVVIMLIYSSERKHVKFSY